MTSKFRKAWKESGLPEVEVSRPEITSIKAELKALGPDGYQEMLRVMSHPAAVFRVRAIPGTQALQFALNVLIIANSVFVILPLILVLLFAVGWASALVAGLLWYFVLSPLQTEMNYEICARLMAVDRKLDKEAEESL
ncbi:MAG: hypothetical protein ACE5JU_24110 [Candidatus Binatia bacterium]